MTEPGGTAVDVVRGEMQPWTDYAGAVRPPGGVVLRRLLADVLPDGVARALIVGPHDDDVVEHVAARAARLTVLLRSVTDAAALRERLAAALPERDAAGQVAVVAGALDGLADRADGPYDLIVAADGLDRVLGPDSRDLDWPARLAALAGLAGAGAVVVVGCANEFALTEVLDRRPAHERHGDEEWRPIHDDPSRPVSAAQLADELTRAGLAAPAVYAAFDVAGAPHTLLAADAAAATRPGRLAARLAARALAAATAARPLLAPVADAAEAAARAGLTGAVAPGWLAVCGAAGHAGYAQGDRPGVVLVADLSAAGWQVDVSTEAAAAAAADGDAGDAEPTGVLAYAPGAVARVPDSESVERVLFRLAAAEDVPAFRAVAARLGEWARGAYTAAEPQAVLSFDDLVVDGDGFAPGVSGWVVVRPATGPELLAAAWYRFGDRLAGHRRHPWPPWLVGDDLVSAWLGMSGEEATAEVLKRGRELADELAVVLGEAGAAKAGAAETGAAEAGAADAGVDLRTALADAAAARTQVTELTGHIAGLERTLGYRDKQLRVRENRIRELRDNVRAVQGSRAFKVAMLIRKVAKLRNPRQAARAVKRRLTRR